MLSKTIQVFPLQLFWRLIKAAKRPTNLGCRPFCFYPFCFLSESLGIFVLQVHFRGVLVLSCYFLQIIFFLIIIMFRFYIGFDSWIFTSKKKIIPLSVAICTVINNVSAFRWNCKLYYIEMCFWWDSVNTANNSFGVIHLKSFIFKC